MKKNRNIIPLLILIVGLLIMACKATKPISNNFVEKSVPESFAQVKDSLNSSNINWKTYFADPNLVSLIDTALNNNLDLLATLQKIKIARADVKYTKGLLLPTVSGVANTAIRRYGDYTMDGAGNNSTEITPGQIVPKDLPDYLIGIQMAWEVDVWGKLRNKKRAAMSRYLATVEGTNWTITNLISEIATTYYELLALDNSLDIIRETIKLQGDALNIVIIQKKAGAANELAVKQFEAQLLNSKSMELDVLQNITMAESKLNFLLGSYPKPIIRNKSLFSKTVPTIIAVGIPADLLTNRPDIRQAELELMATKADVKVAKSAFYPSLNITGALGFQAFNTSYLFTSPQSIAYGLVGTLCAPLINKSAIRANFNQSTARQTEALYNYQKTIINGYVEVYNEMANIRNLQQRYDLKKQEVEVLNQSIETSSELFRTGRATYLEILLTQKNALLAKLEFIDTQKRQYNATTNIYKALGGGWR
jgi:multidrug efflux system outer membrane protein